MPEGRGIHWLVEAQDLLHPAIAVGRDDQILAGQTRFGVRHADENVVMELALLMMRDQVISAPVASHSVQD